jgi:hypothetical protein
MFSIVLRYLEFWPAASPHYETWFGAYVEGLMHTVKSVYSNIDGGPTKARYDLTKCTDETSYAYVVSDEYVLFLYMITV